jgi:predicted GIY-YIG superfamily endonuclease
MNKYNNGKIYIQRCHDDQNLIYVGSTTQPLYKRLFEHKRDVN